MEGEKECVFLGVDAVPIFFLFTVDNEFCGELSLRDVPQIDGTEAIAFVLAMIHIDSHHRPMLSGPFFDVVSFTSPYGNPRLFIGT